MQRGSTNPRGRWVELLQSRVSLLSQLASCHEGCSARAPTGFELLSSCRARRLLTVFSAHRHRVGLSLQGFRPGTCCHRVPAPIANPRTHLVKKIALTIADFSAWYELLHRPVGACHRSMMSSLLIATIPAPPSVVPSWVDPSVYIWMSVGRCLLWQQVLPLTAGPSTSTWKHRSSPWELVVDGSKLGQVWVVSDPPDGTSVGPSLTGPQEQWCASLVDEAVASRSRSGPLAAGPRHRDCSTC